MAAACIFSGGDEALAVESNARSAEPIGIRLGANEQEQVPDRPPYFFAARAKPAVHGLQNAVVSFEAADCGAGHHLDIGETVNAVDQIARHRLGKIAAHDHPDFPYLARQIDHRLTGRVATSD